MKYAHIEDGEVKRYLRKLPVKDASLEELKARNILPVEVVKPTLQPWQSKGARSEDVQADKVVVTFAVNTQPLPQYKAGARKRLLDNAKRILDSRLDAIEQMPSVYKALPASRRNKMDADAQAVVDEVTQKRQAINNASDYAAVDLIYTGIVAFMDPADLDENGFPIPEEE